MSRLVKVNIFLDFFLSCFLYKLYILCKYQIITFLRKIWGSKTFLFFDEERTEWHIQLRKDLKYDGTGIDLVARYPEATNPINAGILDCTGKFKPE